MLNFIFACFCIFSHPAVSADAPSVASYDEPSSLPILWDVDWDAINWRFNPDLPFLFIESGFSSRARVFFSPEVKAGDLFLVPLEKGHVCFQVEEVDGVFDGGSYGLRGRIVEKLPRCVKKKAGIQHKIDRRLQRPEF